jgi:hypothetical protein
MKDTYHFALVGQTKSGKTCYLTTLAMRAIGHPGDLTVAWRRDMLGTTTPSSPAGPQPTIRTGWGSHAKDAAAPAVKNGRSSYDDERTARANGIAWISAAITAIEKKDLPKGNPPEKCILDYEIGSPDRGTTRVCLVDYSGESIDADMKGPARDGILRHFRTCDGLIVVAEAIPDDDPDRAEVEARVRKVIDFFVSLHGDDEQRLATAIAVVITKWDTVSTVDFDAPASENADIEAYIAERPLYQNLVNAISNMVLQQHDVTPAPESQVGLQKGNARVFASSSFGHSVQEPDGRRKPLLSERRPFCLIDPLLWLANRADAISVADLGRASRGPAAWLPWNAWRTARRSSRAMARMPRKSKTHQQAAGYRASAIGRFAAAMALLLLIGDAAYYAAMRSGIESRRTAVRSGRTTPIDLAAARDYGLAVAASPWNGLLPAVIPGLQPDGRGLATQATEALEKTLGDAVEQAKRGESVKTLTESLEAYLEHLPTGEHAGEYAGRLKELRDQARLQQAIAQLSEIAANIPTLDEATCSDRLSRLSDLCMQADQWSTAMTKDASRIRQQLVDRQGVIIREQSARALAETIAAALEAHNYVAAVDAVVAHADKNADWEQKVAGLPSRIVESCRARAQALAGRGNFAEATQVGGAALAALRKADDLPARFTEPREAFNKSGPQCTAMLAEVVERPYDQHLYDQVRNQRSEDACRNYLAKAPLKSMERPVLQYSTYVEEQNKPRTIRVAAHITWGDLYSDGGTVGYAIHQVVSVNQNKKIDAHLRTYDRKGTSETFGDTFDLYVTRADQPLDVAIRFTEDDWPSDDDNIGSWNGPFTPLQMQSRQKIEVDGDPAALASPHFIWFSVEGNPYPSEPLLPSWSERP